MKKYINVLATLFFFVVAFSLSSCNREEDLNNNGDGNNNNPLTNETIIGKKYYTNKLPGFCWCQWEIRFAANDVAYLTETRTNFETGQETTSAPIKATYNLVFPDVVFEDEDGNNYPATFIDNNTLVFNGDNIAEDSLIFRFTYSSTTKPWGQFSGWHFRSTPNTITGPYVGQKYTGSSNGLFDFVYSCSLCLGVDYAALLTDYFDIGRLIIDYPNITIGTNFLEGRFVDENTILLTKYCGNNIQEYNIRLRNINAGPEPEPDPGEDTNNVNNLPTALNETFNNGIPNTWTIIDADGDGLTWELTSIAYDGTPLGVNGTDAVCSKSYTNNYGPLTPDNYLITPKIHIFGTTLTWQVCAQDANYPEEHYSVLVGDIVNGVFVAQGTLFEETLSSSKAQGTWFTRSVNLSAYNRQDLRIAFRHYNCTDMFSINIDNIEVQ